MTEALMIQCNWASLTVACSLIKSMPWSAMHLALLGQLIHLTLVVKPLLLFGCQLSVLLSAATAVSTECMHEAATILILVAVAGPWDA